MAGRVSGVPDMTRANCVRTSRIRKSRVSALFGYRSLRWNASTTSFALATTLPSTVPWATRFVWPPSCFLRWPSARGPGPVGRAR